MKKKTGKHILSVFGDYCSTGIWLDGTSLDPQELYRFGFIPEQYNSLIPDLNQYQSLYEGFDFWSENADHDKIYASNNYRKFNTLGRKIFRKLTKIAPGNIIVEFMDEKTGNRYKLVNHKYVVNERKCD